jgi:thiol-disulfide isomerase/thioredoxin
MKTVLLLSPVAIASAYFVHNPSRKSRLGLNYKTHEFEYGVADDRVRRLTSDDRVSALNLLETVVTEKKRSPKTDHQKATFSEPRDASRSASITTKQSDYWSDVDADRFSLASLLEPPAPPFNGEQNSHEATPVHTKQAPTRLTTKATSITPLHSIEEYNHNILSNNGSQLKIIRFSAPWCQVCRTTNVAFERMASKLSKGGDVQFYSVLIDSNKPEDAKNLLKDHLEVLAVPTGVLYHPSRGIIGRVNLNRGNLNELKKRLTGYSNGALHRQGEMMWMEALVMGLQVEKEQRNVPSEE